MSWHGSDSSFYRHKSFLDKILNGQREFIHDKPDSLARRLRGALRNVREKNRSGYESLFAATVHVTPIGVKIDLNDVSARKTKAHTVESIYDIILVLGSPTPQTDYIFKGCKPSRDEISILYRFCENSNLILVSYDHDIRITTNDREKTT